MIFVQLFVLCYGELQLCIDVCNGCDEVNVLFEHLTRVCLLLHHYFTFAVYVFLCTHLFWLSYVYKCVPAPSIL